MIPAISPVVPPLLAAALLVVVPGRLAAWVSVAGAGLALLAACLLAAAPPAPDGWLVPDRLALHLVLLVAFIGLTAAVAASGRPAPGERRSGRGAVLYQALLGCLLLALLADDVALSWLAAEAAVIVGALGIGHRGAGHRMLLVCGLGLALACLGTVLLCLAAQPALGPGPAVRWSALLHAAGRCDGAMLSLAFVFLLIGYGTLAALVPLHGWLGDAQAEAPMPIAVLSGGLPVVGLAAILRLRGVVAADPQAMAPGPAILALGLASLLLAAGAVWRLREPRRLLAATTIGQGGVVAFAFGLGGPAAVFAGLLHLTVLTLLRAALLPCLDRAAFGVTIAAGLLALAGLPPFGMFASSFLIGVQTVRLVPALMLPLGGGLVLLAWVLLRRLGVRGSGPALPLTTLLPAWAALLLAGMLGLAMPQAVFAWFAAAAAGVTTP